MCSKTYVCGHNQLFGKLQKYIQNNRLSNKKIKEFLSKNFFQQNDIKKYWSIPKNFLCQKCILFEKAKS